MLYTFIQGTISEHLCKHVYWLISALIIWKKSKDIKLNN